MKAKDLIGKKAVRTAPVRLTGDRSYGTTPILIQNVTDSHIVYTSLENFLDDRSVRLLNSMWIDDNWTNYE
jgi:hypothetical protein